MVASMADAPITRGDLVRERGTSEPVHIVWYVIGEAGLGARDIFSICYERMHEHYVETADYPTCVRCIGSPKER